MLRLSQGQLNWLTICPRKFQHVVLDQLGSPEAVEQQERLLQGAQFHLLLQQWLMDLPVEPIVQEDQQLQHWFNSFREASPQILGDGMQQPESDRLLEFEGFLFTVRYDLLVTSEHYAKILDWKTYPRPQKAQWLEQNWQTRLYPFVLAETSSYRPEQIAIVYWFFQGDREASTPQSLTFPYNSRKHEETRQALKQILHSLTHWLAQYQVGEPFPQLALGATPCEDCAFAPRCDRLLVNPEARTEEAENKTIGLPNLWSLAEIEEIPL